MLEQEYNYSESVPESDSESHSGSESSSDFNYDGVTGVSVECFSFLLGGNVVLGMTSPILLVS